MLSLKDCIEVYSHKGVIHVGANSGQERDLYHNLGKLVHWIEADPNIYPKLEENIEGFPNQTSMCALIYDTVEKVEFNLSKQSERSSIFAFTNHHFKDDNFHHLDTIELQTTRLDILFQDGSIDLVEYDTLVTDCQGADLNIIRSLGNNISQFNLIVTEVFFERCYENILLAKDFNSYMKQNQFKLVGEFGRKPKWSNYIYLNEKTNP